MSIDEYGPPNGDRRTVTERVADSKTLMAYARVSMVVLGFTMPIALGVSGWMANRLVTTMDKISDKQEQSGKDFVQLQTQVVNIVSSQVASSRNIADRITEGERVLNDRISAQSVWTLQIGAKLDELAKYVYQKVR